MRPIESTWSFTLVSNPAKSFKISVISAIPQFPTQCSLLTEKEDTKWGGYEMKAHIGAWRVPVKDMIASMTDYNPAIEKESYIELWLCTPILLTARWRLRQEDYSELKASLGYKVNSRLAWDM